MFEPLRHYAPWYIWQKVKVQVKKSCDIKCDIQSLLSTVIQRYLMLLVRVLLSLDIILLQNAGKKERNSKYCNTVIYSTYASSVAL